MKRMISESVGSNISKLFERGVDEFGKVELAERLGVPKGFVTRALKKKDVPVDHFLEAGHRGNFSLRTLCYRNPDESSFISFLKNEKEILPSRYKKAARTKRLASMNLLSAINRLYGSDKVYYLLQTLQTTPDVFAKKNQNKLISTEFNSDLLKVLKTEYSNISIDDIGRKTAHVYKTSKMGKIFSKLKTKDIYAKLGEEVFKSVEKSHMYKLQKLSNKKAVFHKILSPELVDELKTTSFSNQELSSFLCSIISSFPELADQKRSKFKQTKSFYNGQGYCEYVYEF